MNRRHRPHKPRSIERHRLQPPLFGVAGNGRPRQNADAQSRSHRLFDALNIVELHHPDNIDTVFPQEPVNLPPDDHFLVKGDELLSFEILAPQPCPV